MSYFYTSPTSNIPPQPLPTAIRMTRTGSSSSTASTSSNSSSISIPSPHHKSPSSSRPGSSSASFSSSYWPSSSTTCSPSSFINHQHGQSHGRHSRHSSNGTSYLPTPFRSALLHSSSASSSSSTSSSNRNTNAPSSYFSDDELLSLSLESTHLAARTRPPTMKREMTTEEQVAAVREQVEREREGAKPEAWWQMGCPGQAAPLEKRSRVVRFAGDARASAAAAAVASGRGKRRSVVMGGNGRGSSRRD